MKQPPAAPEKPAEGNERGRRNPFTSDISSNKKEAINEFKRYAQEPQNLGLATASEEWLSDWLRNAQAVLYGGSATGRLLWLTPAVTTADSINLLRRAFAAPWRSSGEHQNFSVAPSGCTAVTGATRRGHFTLELGDATRPTKSISSIPMRDAALLIAIFNGLEVSSHKVPCL